MQEEGMESPNLGSGRREVAGPQLGGISDVDVGLNITSTHQRKRL